VEQLTGVRIVVNGKFANSEENMMLSQRIDTQNVIYQVCVMVALTKKKSRAHVVSLVLYLIVFCFSLLILLYLLYSVLK